MKIAIYTIALNEEQFVEKWYNSAKEADYLLIADTGSTDNTENIAKSLGIHLLPVGIKPWRFDDARNAALASLPLDIDYCIALDMDEVLLPGWRKELEKAFKEKATRPRYKYTWSWNEDGSPGLEYGGDKIHARQGYRWKHPVHEVLTSYSIEERQFWIDLKIQHHPDPTKSRAQYYPLLKMAVNEDLSDDRNAYYYARELFFNSLFEEAAVEFKRHLSLPKAVWAPERAASYRYLAKCEPINKEMWLKKSISESNRREGLVELAHYYYEKSNWGDCFEYAEKALSIIEKPLDYLCEADAWGNKPYDLAAISAYHLGKLNVAVKYGEQALALSSNDKRLENNLKHYKGNV